MADFMTEGRYYHFANASQSQRKGVPHSYGRLQSRKIMCNRICDTLSSVPSSKTRHLDGLVLALAFNTSANKSLVLLPRHQILSRRERGHIPFRERGFSWTRNSERDGTIPRVLFYWWFSWSFWLTQYPPRIWTIRSGWVLCGQTLVSAYTWSWDSIFLAIIVWDCGCHPSDP